MRIKTEGVSEVLVRLVLKIIIVMGIILVGVWAIVTLEGSASESLMLGIGFGCVIMLGVVSVWETIKELKKEWEGE